MSEFKNNSEKLYISGYSCSEAIVSACYENGIITKSIDKETLTMISSAFSGGMGGSGCLCGAVAGAQIILGLIFGRRNAVESSNLVRKLSRELIDEFKKIRRTTCCRALSAGYEFNSPERRKNCTEIVIDVAGILEKQIMENLNDTKALELSK